MSNVYHDIKELGLLVGPGSYTGPCSWFGGQFDQGVKESEGLAFFQESDLDEPELLLHHWVAYLLPQDDRRGMARRILDDCHGCALPYDYSLLPKDFLRNPKTRVLVRRKLAPGKYKSIACRPLDWGPDVRNVTARIDLTRGAMKALGAKHGDVIEYIVPSPTDVIYGWLPEIEQEPEVTEVSDVRDKLPPGQGTGEITKPGTKKPGWKWASLALVAAALAAWATGGWSGFWTWLVTNGGSELLELIGTAF